MFAGTKCLFCYSLDGWLSRINYSNKCCSFWIRVHQANIRNLRISCFLRMRNKALEKEPELKERLVISNCCFRLCPNVDAPWSPGTSIIIMDTFVHFPSPLYKKKSRTMDKKKIIHNSWKCIECGVAVPDRYHNLWEHTLKANNLSMSWRQVCSIFVNYLSHKKELVHRFIRIEIGDIWHDGTLKSDTQYMLCHVSFDNNSLHLYNIKMNTNLLPSHLINTWKMKENLTE